MIAQQVLRKDLSQKKKEDIVHQLHFLYDTLGNLQHHDAITGTSVARVTGDFQDKARIAKMKVLNLNAQLFTEKLQANHGLIINSDQLNHTLEYFATWTDFTTPYSHDDSFMFAVQNPSPQIREQMVEIEVPYYNYTVHEIINGEQVEITNFDKLLPRTLLNSNKTVVKAYLLLRVKFDDPHQLSKAYIIKNLGVIRPKYPPPANYTGYTEIWNLNLPLFLQKEGWEINNFQSNFKKVRKDRAIIKAGSKTLELVTIISNSKQEGGKSMIDQDLSVNSTDVKIINTDSTNFTLANGSLPANLTEIGEVNQTSTNSSSKQGGKNHASDAKGGASKEQKPGAAGGKGEAKGAKGGKGKNETNSGNKTMQGQNEGSALFILTDHDTGVSQKFAFSIRHYWGAGSKVGIHDGLYEFSVNGTAKIQRSFPYGKIRKNKIQMRQNNNSGEFVLVYEKKQGQETVRASARIQINAIDPFVKFNVELNEIPIKKDKIGKDIVVDWYFYDNIDTGGDIFIDANGLEMINKKLNYRKEYPYNSNETISSNYYPVTSAIAIRDANKTNWAKSGGVKRQVTIMNDRSQGGSAGLRQRKNIEMMQHRRFKNSDYYGVFEPDNDLDQWGRGIQVLSSYFMMIHNYDKNGTSRQREVQRKIDQPLLEFYTRDYKLSPIQQSAVNKMNFTLAQSPKGKQIKINSTKEFSKFNASANSTSQNQTDAAITDKKSNSMAQNVSDGANATNGTAKKTKTPKLPPQLETPANAQFKESKLVKTILYPINANEMLLRITNLDDRFDGKTNADFIMFDVNAFAREMYLEANDLKFQGDKKQQAKVQKIKIEIEEMNLAGAVGLNYLNTSDHLTKWKTQKTEDPPKGLVQKPKDRIHDVQLTQRRAADDPNLPPFERVNVIALEPQRIRTFRIKYIMPNETFVKQKPIRIADQKNATRGFSYYDEYAKNTTATNQTQNTTKA